MALDMERLRSIGHLKGGRTMARSTSGREHPDSGLPFKVTTDEAGTEVTEHGRAGTGLSERQDVNIHPETYVADVDLTQGH
jgi:hypothetical protein